MWISLRWIPEGTEKLHEIWMFLSFLFWKNFCIRIQNDKIWQILGHWDIQDNGSVVDFCCKSSIYTAQIYVGTAWDANTTAQWFGEALSITQDEIKLNQTYTNLTSLSFASPNGKLRQAACQSKDGAHL